MAIKIKLKHSSTANKAPLPSDLDAGELALNTNAASPAAYLKDSAGNIVKLAGAGSASTPDATTTAKGIVQLADATAITAGTAGRVVDAAQLKAVSDADDWTRTGTTLAPKTAGDVVSISAGTAALPGLTPVGDPDTGVWAPAADTLAISTNGTEKVRVDPSGKLLVGTSSSVNTGTAVGANVEIFGSAGSLNIRRGSNNNSPAIIALGKSRNATDGSYTIVNSDDIIGTLRFAADDGTDLQTLAAEIKAAVDGTPGANDMPGRLVFSTTAVGASTPTERMRIDSAGLLKVSNNNTYGAGGYHQFNQNASSQWTLGVLGRNAVDPYGIRVEYTNAAPNNTVSQFLSCIDTAGVKAEIRSNGGLANYQANDVNLSDRNAKKDISPAADTWDCIKEWEIVNYRYKDQLDDADLNLGVIAQQVAESCPEVITVFQEATEDEPEKLGVKEQQMYWMAIKALQEAQVRIEQLEQRLTDAGIA